MMMAVVSDPPDLENAREFQSARNSVLVDLRGRRLGVLTNNRSPHPRLIQADRAHQRLMVAV